MYTELLKIDDSYNTMDGPTRWLAEHGYPKVTLGAFSSVIPQDVRKRMTRWTFGDTGWGPEHSQRQQAFMESMRSFLVERYGLDDPSAERRILLFLSRTKLSEEESRDVLASAFKHADDLMTQLSIARLIEPEQHEFEITRLHELYDFAQKHFSLSPEAIWVIMRLKRINIAGVGGLVRRGERLTRRDVSLQAPTGSGEEPKSPTVEDRIGRVDPGFSQVEARMVLEKISESGHLSQFEMEVLEDVINGRDLEDEEYEMFADAIRKHPELMELLGIDDEF
jgi:hypothetical protein